MAPAGSTSIILTGVAAKKLVENVITDLYSLAKQEAGFHLKKWKAANHADTIYKRIRQLRLVKTIWQIEKEIDLTSFYHPSRVRISDRRIVVRNLSIRMRQRVHEISVGSLPPFHRSLLDDLIGPQ